MKPSIKKLRKFFRLEAERGYDNKAVMGGLVNILSSWEMDAREDNLSEQTIQAVISRLRDYHRLSEESREVALKGIWQRVTKETEPDQEQHQADLQEADLHHASLGRAKLGSLKDSADREQYQTQGKIFDDLEWF